MPRKGTLFHRGVTTSVLIHGLAFLAMFWRPAAIFQANRAPGDEGPLGGGGGGVRTITYFTLEEVARERTTQQQVPQPQLELVIPEVAEVTLDLTPRFEVPREVRGSGGGRGAGPGFGGGVGSGAGTGRGTAVGPGTGGGGGEIFPPVPRYVAVPLPKPASVQGKTFTVRLWVDARGRVTRVEVEPRIRDAAYRRKFIEDMYQLTFSPAMTRDGERVAGQIAITIRL